jgi:ubiquinone/menaquinone biosynthesis C-methylase UbiE
VYCSHVLQYIPDDVAAIREIFRVLKPGGWAMIQVRVDRQAAHTVRDNRLDKLSIDERSKLVHLWDEYREWIYGSDFKERLESAGFAVRVDRPASGCSEEEIVKMGLERFEDVYLCTKAS